MPGGCHCNCAFCEVTAAARRTEERVKGSQCFTRVRRQSLRKDKNSALLIVDLSFSTLLLVFSYSNSMSAP
jgi:hypothetical protein